MNYFDHPFVNNSALSALKKELSGDDSPPPTDAYRFGSLFDAVCTEPHRVDPYQKVILGSGYSFSDEELEVANKMRSSLLKNTFCTQILRAGQAQVEKYIDCVHFQYKDQFHLPMKCKYDLWTEQIFADLKSTSATSQQQFEDSCTLFGYWRQMALYGRLGGIRKAVIIGVSKKNFKVFVVPMSYGDKWWSQGEKELTELAYKYWLYKS